MKKSLLLFTLLQSLLYAQENSYTEADEWGIGIVMRHASIPYQDPRPGKPETAKYVDSAVPLFYYENKYLYLDGIEAGLKTYDNEQWRVSLISRLRFVNTPQEIQNDFQLDIYDFGLQTRYKLDKTNFIDTEILSEVRGNYYANLSYKSIYDLNDWELEPYATLRVKSDRFNSSYYGLIQDIGWGVDYTAGVDIKYHVASNFYLLAGLEGRILDKQAQNALLTDKPYEYNSYFGIAFMRDKKETKSKTLTTSAYVRLSYGYATHSDIDQILGGNLPKEPYGHKIATIFYGHPLSDTLFGLPIESYLTAGFAWHPASKDSAMPEELKQNNIREYVMAIKGYYTIPLPIRIRLGIAEGISYVNEVTYIEKTDINNDGFNESNILNYLDFSLDFNVGDILFTESMEKVWLGVNVHHRSGIFEYSSQYGRISGGSNFPSVHLQMHF